MPSWSLAFSYGPATCHAGPRSPTAPSGQEARTAGRVRTSVSVREPPRGHSAPGGRSPRRPPPPGSRCGPDAPPPFRHRGGARLGSCDTESVGGRGLACPPGSPLGFVKTDRTPGQSPAACASHSSLASLSDKTTTDVEHDSSSAITADLSSQEVAVAEGTRG